MDLKRIRHALTLAQEMNFIRAAEKVHLSQPAFSRSIQSLESELGLALFDRSKQGLAVTTVGAQFLERAKRLAHEASNLERDMHLTRSGEIGQVSFGAGPLVAASVMPQLVQRVRHGRPGLRVSLQVNNPRHLLRNLLNEEIEFFIADTQDIPAYEHIGVTLLMRQYGPFVCRRGHPLLSLERYQLSDLLPYSFASLKISKTTAAALARSLGLPPDQTLPIAVECDNLGLLTQVVCHEDLIMITSHDAVAREIEAGLLSPLWVEDLSPVFAEIGIVQLSGRTLSPAAKLALATLKEIAAEFELVGRDR